MYFVLSPKFTFRTIIKLAVVVLITMDRTTPTQTQWNIYNELTKHKRTFITSGQVLL